jgi:hypothetical protein
LSEPHRKLTLTSKVRVLLVIVGAASLIASDDKTFRAAVQTSSTMVDARDAEKVIIPMVMLSSKDEPKEDVTKYQAALKVPEQVDLALPTFCVYGACKLGKSEVLLPGRSHCEYCALIDAV